MSNEKSEKASTSDDSWSDDCCAICLQTAELPITFPCSHKFCFLCAKGAGFRDKRCPLCRSIIPDDFLSNQSLLPSPVQADSDRYVWFYEGYNGWWRFDDRNGQEIERHFVDGRPFLELLLAGNIYVINFQKMIQYRKSEPAKRRRVKRDLVKAPTKGVAGLKMVSGEVDDTVDSGCASGTSTDGSDKSLTDRLNQMSIADEENS